MTAPESSTLHGLNAAQREAVATTEGPLLVIAGAGSGKTRVITRRIAHLVERGVDPKTILAVTFTNKAAREMRDRVEELVGWGGAQVMTFHAFGVRFLRDVAERLGRPPSFTLFDRSDAESAIKTCLEELKLDKTQYAPRAVLEAIGTYKSRMMGPEAAAEESVGRFEEDVAKIYALYEKLLRRSGAFDFDDLIEKSVRLLDEDEALRERVQDSFRYVLVDEYQDVNHGQHRLTELLAARHGNLCVTGDPDQCIYGWRGAEIHYILDFPREYPEAKVVRLEQNYRSSNTILRAASRVIRFNEQHGDKDLWSENGDGSPIVIRRVADEHEEARAVVERIRTLVNGGARRSEIAIFYRLNSLSLNLERRLLSEGIPYQVVAGLEFFRRKEVKDALAWLRFLANPADLVSLRRVVSTPPRGIGPKTVDRVVERAAADDMAAGTFILECPELLGAFGKRAATALMSFRELVLDLRAGMDGSIAKLLREVLERSNYASHLKARSDGLDPLGNLEQLVGFARDFDLGQSSDRGLIGFLEEVALFTEQDALDREEDRVVLMTVHASKGLEFPHVIVIGVDSELFPHESQFRPSDTEEERRLFYVAMTRAMDSLTLLTACARTRFGRQTINRPSIFLTEIPEELTHCLDDAGGQEAPAMDRDIEYEPDEMQVIQRGARVRHGSFGPGTVSAISGRGDNAKIMIDFDSGERKRFVARYAPLEPLDGWD
jgi:ATP-dependent DNA helicase UvrD/PcrA